MRITAGLYKNKRLQTPDNNDIRPASDKVRQAVFNMLLAFDMPEGAAVMDVFCGTGSYGLEAISRGAKSCVFIDKDRGAIALTRDNAKALSCLDQCTVLKSDIHAIDQKPDTQPAADLVFIDPPYGQNLIGTALETLCAKGWVNKVTICVLEMDKNDILQPSSKAQILREKTYGQSKIIVCRIMQE